MAFTYSSAIAINKTAVIFVRASSAKPHPLGIHASEGIVQIDNESKDANKMNFIYNFDDQSWRRIIDLPDQLSIGTKYNMPLTIKYDKNGTKTLQVFGFADNHGYTFVVENEVSLWSLNLDTMAWSDQNIQTKNFVTFGNCADHNQFFSQNLNFLLLIIHRSFNCH